MMKTKAIARSLILFALLIAQPRLYAQPAQTLMNSHSDSPRLKEIIEEKIDGESTSLGIKTTFTYAAEDSLILQKISRYYHNSDYIEYEQTLIEHDDNGQIISAVLYDLRDGNASPFIETYARYDNQARLSEMAVYLWDDNQRTKSDTYEINYDAEDEIILTQYFYSEDEIIRRHQSIYSFTEDRLDNILYQNSIAFNDYIVSGEKRFVYHESDSSTRADLEQALTSYLPLRFTFTELEYPGLITENITRIKVDNDWSPSEKILTTYNEAFQKLTEEKLRYYSYAWHQKDKTLFYYDSQNILNYTLLQEDKAGTGYQPSKRYKYLYCNYLSNENQVSPAVISLQIYPTPFSNETTIKAECEYPSALEFEIFNIKGQRLRKLFALSETLCIWDGKDDYGKELPSGIYLLKASSDNAISFKKMFKLK